MSSAGLISTVEYIIFASNFTDDSFFCGGLPVHYRYNAINMPSVKNQKLKGPTAPATPGQKPTALLMFEFAVHLPPDSVVVDAFAGTGSTSVAAVLSGHSSVAFERDPDAFDVFTSRLNAFGGDFHVGQYKCAEAVQANRDFMTYLARTPAARPVTENTKVPVELPLPWLSPVPPDRKKKKRSVVEAVVPVVDLVGGKVAPPATPLPAAAVTPANKTPTPQGTSSVALAPAVDEIVPVEED